MHARVVCVCTRACVCMRACEGSGSNASDGSGGNASDGEWQMKLRSIALRSPPAVLPVS